MEDEKVRTLHDLDLSSGLNAEQEKALMSLKTSVESNFLTCKELAGESSALQSPTFQLNDSTLIRFLVANGFIVDATKEHLKKHLEWRDQMLPSQIKREDVLPSLLSSGVFRLMGQSKDGYTVIQFKLQLLDPYAQELEPYLRYIVYCMEESIKRMKKHIKNIWVFDLDGWAMTTHGTPRGLEFLKQVLVLAQNQYPERLHRALIVQAPWLFSTAWTVISAFLDEKTQNKVQFLKSRKELQQYIDISLIPKSYYGLHAEYPVDFSAGEKPSASK